MATVFDYTGGVQTFVVPTTGLYKLDVWGAQGGAIAGVNGGRGGHSTGYVVLSAGDTLYICVGQQGGNAVASQQSRTAYNGGGRGKSSSPYNFGCGGGGATHIAKVDGQLSAIGYASFVTNGNGLIVAGGGSGYAGSDSTYAYAAGTGGGLNGTGNEGTGATQTTGYAFGKGQDSTLNFESGGGGGGLYGGKAGLYSGGGSGYIGGVPQITYKGGIYMPFTENGVWTGHGRAEIDLIAKGFPTVKLGAISVEDAKLGSKQIEAIYLGSQPLE